MGKYKAIGLMSGTSLDGVDIAYCEFEKTQNEWNYRIVKAETIPYSKKWKTVLSNLHYSKGETVALMDFEYGKYLGQLTKSFIGKHRIHPDFISSHGHTVFHRPSEGYTLQTGNGNCIAAETGLPVISDFRSKDIALGGQGAPLVPVGDKLLFPGYKFCLNIGGIANISFDKNNKRIAFDICPANMLLNYLARKEGHSFDHDGIMARQGEVDEKLLTKLNNISYYRKQPPKSLGKEDFISDFMPVVESHSIPLNNLLRTSTEHIATQIAKIINPESSYLKDKLLITGGGAYNKFLISRISEKCNTEIVIPGSLLVEFKEAMIFAFLGVLRIRNEINVYASVTGAKRDHCSGSISI